MTTDTLHAYDNLVGTGFSEEQARALVHLISPTRTDPEVLSRLDRLDETLERHSQVLDLVLERLDSQEQVLAEHSRVLERVVFELGNLSRDVSGLKQDVKENSADIRSLHEEHAQSRADLHVVEERVKMEGRVSRMINVVLISLGGIAATLAAVFT